MTREEVMDLLLQALDEGNEEHAEHWQGVLDEMDLADEKNWLTNIQRSV